MNQTEKCFICGDARENSLETHHLVPKRYGGTDTQENLVDLCASCHAAIEKLYDDGFYERLGVSKERKSTDLGQCMSKNCTSTKTVKIENKSGEFSISLVLCDAHKECGLEGCERTDVSPIPVVSIEKEYLRPTLRCQQHIVCANNGCANTRTALIDKKYPQAPLCQSHREQKIRYIQEKAEQYPDLV
jgi:hypothetical protein